MLEEVAAPRPSVSREATLGLVAFVSGEARAHTKNELTERGWLLVELGQVHRDARGNLGERIDAAIELALGLRGAEPAGIGLGESLSEADARLSDQLFRARRLGAPGLVLSLSELADAATGTGVLEVEDGAILQFFALAAHERPLVLLLDAHDEDLAAYTRPMPLRALLRPDTLAEEMGPSSFAAAATTSTAADANFDDASYADDAFDDASYEAAYDDAVTEAPPQVAFAHLAPSTDAIDQGAALGSDELSDLEAVDTEESVALAAAEDAPADAIEVKVELEVAVELEAPAPERDLAAGVVDAAMSTPAPYVPSEPVVPSIDWRKHANALNAAKGPKPLGALEELFAEHYMPLGRAIASGMTEARARTAYDDFGHAFAKAYIDAFPAFALRAKRPQMVMDALDLAQKAARAAGAQRTVVVLVDALRHDVGQLLRDELSERLTGHATLVDERLLWSALPTNTPRQLETLARGMDALRAPQDLDIPTESLRGHAADLVRRVRVGSREFYKLDAVEARLATWRHAGAEGIVEILPGIATAAANALERFALTQPARTLLFVAGDHGFAFDDSGELVAGGASPEEVLVPAFAWMLGDLH